MTKIETAEFKHALDVLLDIAERYFPAYSSSDELAAIGDLYKNYFD